jgi:hypothetical protein
VNTAYVVAAALGVLTALLIFLGGKSKDATPGFLLLALFVLILAVMFAGAGLEIQYPQAGGLQ